MKIIDKGDYFAIEDDRGTHATFAYLANYSGQRAMALERAKAWLAGYLYAKAF